MITLAQAFPPFQRLVRENEHWINLCYAILNPDAKSDSPPWLERDAEQFSLLDATFIAMLFHLWKQMHKAEEIQYLFFAFQDYWEEQVREAIAEGYPGLGPLIFADRRWVATGIVTAQTEFIDLRKKNTVKELPNLPATFLTVFPVRLGLRLQAEIQHAADKAQHAEATSPGVSGSE